MIVMIFSFVLTIIFCQDQLKVSWSDFYNFILLGSYFLICLISLIYSENLDRGVVSLVRKSPLVFFPMYLLFLRGFNKKHIKLSIEVFSYSVVLLAIFSLCKVTYLNLGDFDKQIWEKVTGDALSNAIVSTHKLHFALYVLVAILFLTHTAFNRKSSYINSIFKYISILYLLIFLLMLGTRTTIVTALIFTLIYAAYSLGKQKKYVPLILGSAFIVSTTAYIVVNNPILKDRIKESINYNNEYAINKQWGGTAVRKLIWKYSFQVIEKEPFLGVGIGDSQDELNKSYKNVTESSALKNKNYNAHNEILQILINTGILGLIVFYGSQFALIQINNKKNSLLILFFVVFFLAGLTESYLERDMGIRVYAFFSSVLFISNYMDEDTTDS